MSAIDFSVDLGAAGFGQRIRSRVGLRSGSLSVGVGLLGALLVFSFVASAVGGNPAHQDLAAALVGPGADGHLLGTDTLGRDVLAWVGGGIRTSFEVALGVVSLSLIFGCTVGVVSGLVGGWVDAILMRIADVQLSIPPLPVFIAVSVVLTNNMTSLIVLIAVFGWVPYARLCRARVLTERQRGYVSAARLAGRSRTAIAFVHVLPGITTEISVLASLQAGICLLWEAALSFLGLGLQPPYISLGFLMSEGREVLYQAWWVAVVPGVALALLVVGFNLTGDGIRDLFQRDKSVGTL
ncbi:MAG: ABC transporter permease [Acidimicrobiales bacterium]|jgi:peptide/nickel transport system permease protein